METTEEMSSSLAQVAYSLANQSQSSVHLDVRSTLALESLEPDEMDALKVFLSEHRSLASLLSNRSDPPIENDWWSP